MIALTSNHAVAWAVKQCDVDVIAAYPITPQTTIVEKLSEFVVEGELDAELINVESEHSALSAVLGASATGARTFTATSSQGFALMHEVLHNVAGLRLPVVMAVPTRALSAPISIHNDYSDLMSGRDTGWIIFIASTAQEVYDTIIIAYKVAENKDVMLPCIVAYDGFLMSHTMEAVDTLKDDVVRDFLLHEFSGYLSEPSTLGELAMPEHYWKFKYEQWEAMEKSREVIRSAHEEFLSISGRKYGFTEEYYIDDADFVVVCYGGIGWGNSVEAVRELRAKGKKVGALRVRTFRPFPSDDVTDALRDVKAFAVVERAISFGSSYAGPMTGDILSALAQKGIVKPYICAFMGIGQKTAFVSDFVKLFEMLEKEKFGLRFF